MNAIGLFLLFGGPTVFTFPVHDSEAPGVWICGHCPYMNSGPVCTKCVAMRYDGTELDLGR